MIFDQFVELSGEDDDLELIDGVAVARTPVSGSHEDLFGWLITILRGYARAKGLGIVLGSRTAVQITEHRGRLPDTVFVREEHAGIVQEKGIYGAPDLVIEIVSPGDQPAHIVALEADYRSIGVAEIWFIDQVQEQVRVLWQDEDGYTERVFDQGVLKSEVMEDFWLQVEWLFTEPLPTEVDMLERLLGEETDA